MRCLFIRHRCNSSPTRYQRRLAPCRLSFEIDESDGTKLSSLRSRTHGRYTLPSRMAMLHIWFRLYDDCVDRSSQSYVLHTPTETYKATSTMDGGIDGLRHKIAT